MFHEASAFNQPIGKWNTSQVTNISMMFNAASQFNQPLGSWNTSNVEDMGWIFGYASAFNQDISTWILKDGVRQSSMFTESGMKPDNLCKLKAVGGEWLTLSEVSGAVCPGD